MKSFHHRSVGSGFTLAFICGILSFPLAASEVAELSLQSPWLLKASAEHFNWTEEDPRGGQLLEEDGFLFVVGVERDPVANQPDWILSVEGFIGSVDYDGQLQNGTPWQDDTDYTGVDVEVGASIPLFPSAEPADPSVALLATLGCRFWSRDLTVESDEASGYVEDWTHVYSRFGARYRTRKPDGVNWYGEFSLLVPWQTENDVDGGLSLEPDGNIGWSIDLGVEKGSWSLSLSWVQQTWDVSDAQRALGIDAAGNIFPIQVFQPASDENRIGLRISYRF